jgi:hypothetical protein
LRQHGLRLGQFAARQIDFGGQDVIFNLQRDFALLDLIAQTRDAR